MKKWAEVLETIPLLVAFYSSVNEWVVQNFVLGVGIKALFAIFTIFNTRLINGQLTFAGHWQVRQHFVRSENRPSLASLTVGVLAFQEPLASVIVWF